MPTILQDLYLKDSIDVNYLFPRPAPTYSNYLAYRLQQAFVVTLHTFLNVTQA
jgi:hypothetical protein